MFALGLAVPARADDAPSPSPTVPSAVTAVATPTAPDTSQAAAAVDVAAAQVGAAPQDLCRFRVQTSRAVAAEMDINAARLYYRGRRCIRIDIVAERFGVV